MKKIATIILLIVCFISNAQEKKNEIVTVSFKVSGTCEQCKKRIENAVDIKGVKFAEWDVKTQMLKITYRTDKVSETQIKQAILNAGHDVDNEKASVSSYGNLPTCCKYRK
ncbi:MAG TPA: cation transporter [Bacteroidia bacterium]|nr:cation transporter [Bacteroidia bacterium]